jgi:prepilin-type processing-associated H-X9-DG protein
LRSLGQAMQIYASEWRGAILGSPLTTGSFLTAPGNTYSDTNCPEICQTWDWQAPIAEIVRASFDTGSTLQHRTIRFQYLCNYKPFVCPDNDIISPAYSASPIKPSTKMISYYTTTAFLEVPGFGITNAYGYSPKVTKVGDSSEKIYMSDGARWCDDNATPPDYNESFTASDSGNDYSDWGAVDHFSRSFLREPPITKPIVYSMRHGSRLVGAPRGAYKFNAVFFDGHAETLTGTSGINPKFWFPKGTIIPPNAIGSYEFTADAVAEYKVDNTKPFMIAE